MWGVQDECLWATTWGDSCAIGAWSSWAFERHGLTAAKF